MAAPYFSLIIPTRNEEKLLPAMFADISASLRAAEGIEVIVTDAGSTDGTIAIAQAHADRTVVHALPHAQTIAEGRNAGAAVARGEILVFLNADARLENPAAFFAAIRARFADAKINAATFPVSVFPEERRGIDSLMAALQNGWFRLMNVFGLGMGRGECQVVRRAAFERVGGYNAPLAAGEDFDLFRRLRRLGPIAWMGDCRVFESPRRYRRYGYVRVWGLWFANAVGVMFAGHSASRAWEEVR